MLSIFATPAEAIAWAQSVNVGREKHERVGVPRRPLKPKTLERIARGLDKFVLKAAKPFIVDIQNYGWGSSNKDINQPMPTITSGPKGGAHAVVDVAVSPIIARCAHGDDATTGAKRWGNSSHSVETPLPTVSGSKDFAIAAATLAPYTVPNLGERDGQAPRCASVEQPMPTVTGKGNGARLVVATLTRDYDRSVGQIADAPVGAVTGMNHTGLVAATLQTLNHGGPEHRAQTPADPLQTVTGANDARALVAALVTKHYGGVDGKPADVPLDTVTAKDHNAVTVAHLLKFRGGSSGHAADDPVPTITSGAGAARDAGAAHALGVSAVYLSQLRGTNKGNTAGDAGEPVPTITGGGLHKAVVAAHAVPFTVGAGGPVYSGKPQPADGPLGTVMVNDRRALVAAFLAVYYSEGSGKTGQPIDAPAPTVTGHDRIQLVTVNIDGQTYVVTDIAMRMLTPRELARAQGFDDSYIIDRTADDRRISKADQVKLIGNSVCPQVAQAIVKANIIDQGVLDDRRRAAIA